MGLATFIGGIHPYEGKELSEDKPIKVLEPLQGEIMVYPLSQHIGAPAKPLVAKARSLQRQADLFPQTYSVLFPVR